MKRSAEPTAPSHQPIEQSDHVPDEDYEILGTVDGSNDNNAPLVTQGIHLTCTTASLLYSSGERALDVVGQFYDHYSAARAEQEAIVRSAIQAVAPNETITRRAPAIAEAIVTYTPGASQLLSGAALAIAAYQTTSGTTYPPHQTSSSSSTLPSSSAPTLTQSSSIVAARGATARSLLVGAPPPPTSSTSLSNPSNIGVEQTVQAPLIQHGSITMPPAPPGKSSLPETDCTQL